MNQLLSDITQLRQCCPWYQAQNMGTLRTYLIEEFNEVLEALENMDPNTIKEEFGDLLFQILLYSHLAGELGWFNIAEVMEELHHKIIRRNQHVFGTLNLTDIESVNSNWQSVKNDERTGHCNVGTENIYKITIEKHKASIAIKNSPPIAISLTPLPAQRFTKGYSYFTWIWLALTEAFQLANISIPDDDVKMLAIRIAKLVQAGTECKQGSILILDGMKYTR